MSSTHLNPTPFVGHTNTFKECNDNVLNQPMEFFDPSGSTIRGAHFYLVLQNYEGSAKGLQDRVIELCNTFDQFEKNKAKPTGEMISARDKCIQQFDQLMLLSAQGISVVEQLKIIRGDIDIYSPVSDSMVIKTVKDIDVVCGEITKLAGNLTYYYLTEGTMSWYLPDYINKLKGFKV